MLWCQPARLGCGARDQTACVCDAQETSHTLLSELTLLLVIR